MVYLNWDIHNTDSKYNSRGCYISDERCNYLINIAIWFAAHLIKNIRHIF